MMNKLGNPPAQSSRRPVHPVSVILLIAGALSLGLAVQAQQPAPPQSPGTPPATNPPASQPDVPWTTAPADQTQSQTQAQPQSQIQAQAPAAQLTAPPPAPAPDARQTPPAPESAPAAPPTPNYPGEISESAIKQLLVGKPLILRDGYQDDDLRFNENGQLIDRSPKGSFTLSGIQINRVRLTKHKLELEGDRYGLRFSSSLQSRDPNESAERVKITPKKKTVKITIDRELVITPKKEKEKKKKGATPVPPAKPSQVAAAQPAVVQPPAATPAEPTDADEAKAQIAAAPAAERPADPNSVTTTNSAQHANALLRKAIDHVFSQGIDDRLIAAMPPYWRIYYQANSAGKDLHSDDPAVLRQNAVDTKAHLITIFEAKSNDYAQAHDVAGMEELHAVVGADGKVRDVVISQPIGFGLDENAVDSISKATFEPALKDGKPVPVELDLLVKFHIYSKLTSGTANTEEAQKAPAAPLPGPYSLKQ
jgi:outer membrane biosynthesis protein TonB